MTDFSVGDVVFLNFYTYWWPGRVKVAPPPPEKLLVELFENEESTAARFHPSSVCRLSENRAKVSAVQPNAPPGTAEMVNKACDAAVRFIENDATDRQRRSLELSLHPVQKDLPLQHGEGNSVPDSSTSRALMNIDAPHHALRRIRTGGTDDRLGRSTKARRVGDPEVRKGTLADTDERPERLDTVLSEYRSAISHHRNMLEYGVWKQRSIDQAWIMKDGRWTGNWNDDLKVSILRKIMQTAGTIQQKGGLVSHSWKTESLASGNIGKGDGISRESVLAECLDLDMSSGQSPEADKSPQVGTQTGSPPLVAVKNTWAISTDARRLLAKSTATFNNPCGVVLLHSQKKRSWRSWSRVSVRWRRSSSKITIVQRSSRSVRGL